MKGIRHPAWIGLALALVGAGVFAPSLRGPWILDDWHLIANNAAVQSLQNLDQWVVRSMWDLDLAVAQLSDRLSYWRPLVMASYAVDWRWGGGTPAAFHTTNLLLHGIVAALAFVTLRRWSGSLHGAALGALIFVVHPTKAESVAWIAGRTDVLVTLWMLLACAGIALRLSGRAVGWAVEIGATLLAYLSKEQAVTLPVFAAVELWVALGRPPLGRELWRPRVWLWALAPQGVALILYLLLRSQLLPVRGVSVTGLTPLLHAGFFFETWGRYFVLLLLPDDLSVSHALIRSDAGGVRFHAAYAALGAAGLATLAAAIYALRRRHPAQAVGLCLFGACLLPVSNLYFTAFSTLAAPRFLYVPLLGIALALAARLHGARRLAVWGGLTVLVAVLFGGRSLVRAADFASGDRFWEYELERNPDAPLPLLEHARRLRASGRPRAALRVCAEGYNVALRTVSHTGEAGRFVACAARTLAEVTPDVDREALERLAGFLEGVLDGEEGVAILDVAPVHLELPLAGKPARLLRREGPRLEMDAARLRSRLGQDRLALAIAERALRDCPRCPDLALKAVPVALAAGRYDEAERWLAAWAEGAGDAERVAAERARLRAIVSLGKAARSARGAAAVQIEAQRLARLGLWGRAYAVLLPHRSAIEVAGAEPALALAELAYRAGDREGAGEIVSRHAESAAADALLSRWEAETPFRREPSLPAE